MGSNYARLPEMVLVEDNSDDELMSLRAIARSGIACKVTVQRDGAKALEHLLAMRDGPPCVVVLDFSICRA